MGQGGASLHSIQEQRWGVGQGVNEGRNQVGRVVGLCENGGTGSVQWGRAVHGVWVVLCQLPLR